MRKVYLVVISFIIANTVFAQSGKISGNVISAISGRALDGATVTLIENSKTISADQNGSFSFSKLAPGKYSIKCSYTGHVEKIVDEITVKENDNTVITISLEQKQSGEVVVTATRSKAAGETVASLLIAQKNSANVSDGITAQQIRQTPDKSTSDVIKRVSGASIQDDRFAIIRGLNDRYNAAFINGAPLPSTESDRKAFAFDIFPSAILDNLVIYKTSTPDKSGEFAGGLIEITTKSIPSKNFTTLSFGVSYNTLITGKDRYFSENKGKTDWLGIDDGTRALPPGMPTNLSSNNFNKIPDSVRGQFAKQNRYKWGIKHENTTSPNYNFQLTKGFNVQRKQQDFLGAVFSVNYNRNYTLNAGERKSYGGLDPQTNIRTQYGNFRDSIYNDEVVLAALGNIVVKINNRNSISWKNNFSINTDNKLLKRSGFPDYTSDSVFYAKQNVRFYTSNQIFTSQLGGEHVANSFKTKINWLAAYSNVTRDIPMLARTQYVGSFPNININDLTPSGPIIQSGGGGVMFYSKLNENIKSFKYDITQPYTFMKNAQNFIKLGAGIQRRARTFESGAYGFTQSALNPNPYTSPLPEDQIFLPQYLGLLRNGQLGLIFTQLPFTYPSYTASSSITHVYLMNDQRFFKRFRLIYGVRMEDFNQKFETVEARNGFPTDSVRFNKTITDFLPSVNFVYALTAKTNIRLSYAATVNRPEYRELAPFLFFDDVSGISVNGFVDLKRAKINNYDFRFEYFPGKAQLLSVSAFYKHFKDPIELFFDPFNYNSSRYINSTSAYVYGFEAEFRILLSTLFGIKKEDAFLSKFTLSANTAYMKSNVRTDSLAGYSPSIILRNRPLQGQSPYIINASLNFNYEKWGLSSTLSANRVGDRQALAGNNNNPGNIEKARTVIDFQLTKSFLKNTVELKLNIKDLLAQDINFYNDYDLESKLYSKDKDFYTSAVKAPRIISLSATFKL